MGACFLKFSASDSDKLTKSGVYETAQKICRTVISTLEKSAGPGIRPEGHHILSSAALGVPLTLAYYLEKYREGLNFA